LDFYSGSATTAHAVMQLNAEDGGYRRFIMVQLTEACAPDSEAAKSGYKNIVEIGKEPIRRAGENIKEGLKAQHADWKKKQALEFKKGGKLDLDDDLTEETNLKKGGFIIDTPHGHYSPYWAIVCRQTNGHLRLYFIIETKMAKDWDDLSEVEKSKIKCGELHFKAVSNEIKFDWVNSYKSFKSKVG